MLNKLCVAFGALVLLSSCGGSDDIAGRYEVDDVNIDSSSIAVGQTAKTEIFFETRIELDGTADGLDVIVRLAPELAFVSNSSRIYDDSTDDSDTRAPDDLISCPDGHTFVVYHFDDNDLEGRSISGSSGFGFEFEVRGLSATSSALVEAAAAKNQDFSCASVFDAEALDSVAVL